MSDGENKSFLQKTESPTAVFVYRLITGVGTILVGAVVSFTFGLVNDMRKDLVDVRIFNANMDGRILTLNDRVNIHANRLNSFDERQTKFDDRLTKVQIETNAKAR